jgi:hypothetical protein
LVVLAFPERSRGQALCLTDNFGNPIGCILGRKICHALLGKGGSDNPLTADKFHALGFLRLGRISLCGQMALPQYTLKPLWCFLLTLIEINVICLIFHTKYAMVAETYNYWVQPLIKRESIWMYHKTLFPVLEMGFLFWTS